MEPEMHPTPESTSISEIGYDEANEEVWVRIGNSSPYIYSGVPSIVWQDFRAAPSKGVFFNQVIKPGYSCRRA